MTHDIEIPVTHTVNFQGKPKEGDMLEIKYEDDLIGQFICKQHQTFVTKKLVFVPTIFFRGSI